MKNILTKYFYYDIIRYIPKTEDVNYEQKTFKICVIAVTLILVMMSFPLGCSSDGKRVSYEEFMNREVYEEGYFKYLLYSKINRKPMSGEKVKAAIVGLTDEGQKQEVLEIPRTVGDNIPVERIGFEYYSSVLGADYFHIETPNLKKTVYRR